MEEESTAPHEGENAVVRVRLDLAYDGSDFSGWASQPGRRTVQGLLEEGLATLVQSHRHLEPAPFVQVAGRTDAGVHARGQVAHVDFTARQWRSLPGRSQRRPCDALVTRLGGLLDHDVVVLRAAEAPPGFHARFSATRRTYSYRVADELALRDPLRRTHVLWTRRTLDADAMHAAMQRLIGVRDFAAFCRPRPGATTIRELQEMTWRRPESGIDAGIVVAHVAADAFCHNMVRALVGASLAVGEGRRPIEWPEQVLAARQREPAGGVVPAHGLVLDAVAYPSDDELGTRADAVQRMRMDEDVWDGPRGRA